MENENIPAEKLTSWVSRNLIAFIITGLVVGVTVYIAIYILYNPVKNADGSTSGNLSFIGQTLLPLWATWIGTVLAFYFGKANFEAASKSYQDVIKTLTPEEKISKLPIREVMIPLNKIEYLNYEEEKSKEIKVILDYPRFKDYNRFVVLDQNNVLKYIIHRSIFFEYIYLKMAELKATNVVLDTDKLTLDDLLCFTNEKINNTLTRGFGFVSVESCLLDAKRVIESIEECSDVFITQNGKSTEPILGLVTNNLIFEKGKV